MVSNVAFLNPSQTAVVLTLALRSDFMSGSAENKCIPIAQTHAAITRGQDSLSSGWNIKKAITPGSIYNTFEQESISSLALNLMGRSE